jgi:CheY-like chemotaxis protein
MAITKKIVDMMNGEIEVLTEQGRGSEFIVTLNLPLITGYDPEQTDPEPCACRERAKSARLLLAEDNMINREIANELLTGMGFRVENAENGERAVRMVMESTPGYYSAVLMDIQMPVMDGYEAARAIRELPEAGLSKIPIIAMTANAFREDEEAAREAGMQGHIAKPIDVETMRRTIMEVLDGKSEA